MPNAAQKIDPQDETLEGELIVADENRWPELYKENGLESFLQKIRESASNEVPDVTTVKGRARIGTLAREVSSSKTLFEKPGREYLKKLKAKVKPAEVEIKRFVDECDKLRDKVLQPRKDWEEKEKNRVAGHQRKVTELQLILRTNYSEEGSETLKRGLANLLSIEPDETLEEFTGEAIKLWKQAETQFENLISEREAEEEAAQIEAETKAFLEQQAQQRKEKEEAENQVIHQIVKFGEYKTAPDLSVTFFDMKINEFVGIKPPAEMIRATEAWQKVEKHLQKLKEITTERVAQAKIDAEAEAIENKKRQQKAVKDAAEKAKKKAEDKAVEDKRLEKEAEAKRKANIEHHRKINASARDALMKETALSAEACEAAIKAISSGKIPNVKISY